MFNDGAKNIFMFQAEERKKETSGPSVIMTVSEGI